MDFCQRNFKMYFPCLYTLKCDHSLAVKTNSPLYFNNNDNNKMEENI